MRIIDNPDTYFRANCGSKDSSYGGTFFGQTAKGNDVAVGILKDPDGYPDRRFIFLRSPVIGEEAWYDLATLRDWYNEAGISWPERNRVQCGNFVAYTDINNHNRLVLKFEIDAGDGVRDHMASFTTLFTI